MRPTSRGPIVRRRAVALLVAVAATALIGVVVLRDGDEGRAGGDRGGEETERVPEPVRALVAEMTAEEKVDGVLVVGFEGTEATRPLVAELRSRQLGGVLVGADNWTDADQGGALIADLRRAARRGGDVPPLTVAQQEGGDHRSFEDLPPAERQVDIGDFADPELAERWARQTGAALRRAGFDVNLVPIADVAPLYGPIADRAFSDDPVVAAEMTAAAVRGCRAADIACAARHFPGLGAASQGTDQGPATVSLDRHGLEQRDLAAFAAAIAERVPLVVLSHAFYAAFDPVTPGSLSPQIATELLRADLGFRGVAMTDDLGAGAIKAGRRVPEAAVQALAAGTDLVLIAAPEDQEGVRAALLEAVESGAIEPGRLDEAVGRVLALKSEIGLIRP